MKTFKSFISILNWQTLIIIIISLAATYFCRIYDFTAKFPLTLIGIAVVFPLVFSINSAYKRRELALKHYANLKGNGRAIFFASRDWIDNPDPLKKQELKSVLEMLFFEINKYLHNKDKENLKSEELVLSAFRKMSLAIKDFRVQGMPSGEVSRSNQYLSKMLISFEELKHIVQYRTPLTLRAYSKVFINILPVIYGPYFADVTSEKSLGMAFILPVLFSLILVSLDNIQEHLENPFDHVGEDDVSINAKKFISGLDS
jgi:predicted membrane chloride channel (bestrophin family)